MKMEIVMIVIAITMIIYRIDKYVYEFCKRNVVV